MFPIDLPAIDACLWCVRRFRRPVVNRPFLSDFRPYLSNWDSNWLFVCVSKYNICQWQWDLGSVSVGRPKPSQAAILDVCSGGGLSSWWRWPEIGGRHKRGVHGIVHRRGDALPPRAAVRVLRGPSDAATAAESGFQLMSPPTFNRKKLIPLTVVCNPEIGVNFTNVPLNFLVWSYLIFRCVIVLSSVKYYYLFCDIIWSFF